MKPDIYLIRHAESEANVNPRIHDSTPDHKIVLSPKGLTQANDFGETLANLLSGYLSVDIWCSPYTRTRETRDAMLNFRMRSSYRLKEDPRLREQEWGFPEVITTKHQYESRQNVGHFFYRFPNGESGADVYDRCSHFLESVFRDDAEAVVIFTHGLTLRILAMRLLHASYEEFESWANPANCELKILKHDGESYKLTEPFKTWR